MTASVTSLGTKRRILLTLPLRNHPPSCRLLLPEHRFRCSRPSSSSLGPCSLRSHQHHGHYRPLRKLKVSSARQCLSTTSSRAFSTLASRDDLSYLYTRMRSYDDAHSDEDSSSSAVAAVLLASSASTSALSTHRDNFLQRWVQWLRYVWEQCKDAMWMAWRGGEVALVLSPLVVLTPASIVTTRLFHTTFVSDLTWMYVTNGMQYLGPAFVKLCQWIATRRDLFPPNICDRLAKLHDKGTPHSWQYTQQSLHEAFGDYESKGLMVYPDVIGCGSAAQVHRGTLRTTIVKTKDGDDEEQVVTRDVAIKVLHPRFGAMVNRDLRFLQTISNLLHALPSETIKMLNLPRATQNFGTVLQRQADLRVEGRNLQQFRSNFYRDDDDEELKSSIVFPCPMDDWVDVNVLVEERVVDAIPIAEYLRDTTVEGQEIRKQLASPLLRAFLKMVFIDNFIHSDLHPGNVLIRTSLVDKKNTNTVSSLWKFWNRTWKTNAESPSQPTDANVEVRRTIVFLDAGIATSLSPDDQRNLHDLFRAVLVNDGDRAGRLMIERAKYERCSQVEGGVDAFASGIRDLVSEFHDCRKAGLTLGAVRIGSLLSRVLDLCRIHGVEIDPSMASVVISTLVLEGLGRSLAPSLNLMDFAVPFILGRGRV